MAKKTVIKLNLSKNAPLSVEIQEAVNADQSIMFEANKYEYTDNDKSVLVDAQKAADLANTFSDFEDVTGNKK